MTTDSFIEACDNQKWSKLKYIDVGNNHFVIGFSILIFGISITLYNSNKSIISFVFLDKRRLYFYASDKFSRH